LYPNRKTAWINSDIVAAGVNIHGVSSHISDSQGVMIDQVRPIKSHSLAGVPEDRNLFVMVRISASQQVARLTD
jgi:hypothetical protein